MNRQQRRAAAKDARRSARRKPVPGQVPADPALARAQALHGQGALTEAARLYRGILDRDPNRAEAMHFLGLIQMQQGEADAGASALGRSADLRPERADFQNNYGVALMRLGRLDEAEARFRAALVQDPDYVDALFNLSGALAGRRAWHEAEEALARTVRLRPDHAAAWASLGEPGCGARGRWACAGRGGGMAEGPGVGTRAVRGGLRIDPAAERSGPRRRGHRAVPRGPEGKARRRAAGRRDRSGAGSGRSPGRRGRCLRAGDCRRSVARCGPHQSRLGVARARPSDGSGRKPAASTCAGSGERPGLLQPHAGAAHAVLQSRDPGDDRSTRPSGQAVVGRAGAASLCARQGGIGHRPARPGVPGFGGGQRRAPGNGSLRRGRHRPGVRSPEGCFSSARLREKPGAGAPGEAPVFIVGMPRSGTTLAEQILASHGEIVSIGESTVLRDQARTLGDRRGREPGFPACTAELAVDELADEGRAYLEQTALAAGGPASRIADKLPGNFRRLGWIAMTLPGARIVHCVRDPRDTCLSCFATLFEHGHGFAYDLGELGHYYGLYHDLMRHWATVLPAPVFELRYESLVEDPEATIRGLVDFLGLDWDPACLSFHEARRPVLTASAAQVRDPIHAGLVGRWRRFEKHLGPLVEVLRTAGVALDQDR